MGEMADQGSIQLISEDEHGENGYVENRLSDGRDVQEPDNQRVRRRQLPSDKTYHFFLSFSNKDDCLATALAEHLEKDRGFKCMLADHDFLGNRTTFDNIETAIETSVKMVFLVSNSFLESQYCSSEVSFAYTYASDHGMKDFMIVLKVGCFDDKLFPLKLKSISYIRTDERDITDIGQRIANAFDYVDVVAVVDKSKNGEVIFNTEPEEMTTSMCGGLACEFQPLSEVQRQVLQRFEIEAAEEDYDDIARVVNKSGTLKRYSLKISTRKNVLSCFCLLAGCLALLCSVTVILAMANNGTYSTAEWVGVCFAIFGALIISFIAYYVFGRVEFRKAYKTMHNAAKNSLTLTGKKKCLVLPMFWKYKLYLVFMYYDTTPCLEFLKRQAAKDYSDASPEQIQKLCEETLKDTILNRYAGKAISRVSYPDVVRHPTYRNSGCLCQMVPSTWLLHTKLPSKQPETTEDDPDQTHVMKIVETENSNITSQNTDPDETHVMTVFGE